ncbi:hypothetical protein FKM82_018888 [Ascaphus truei]
MALVTLQRSPTPSATSSASEEFGNDEDRKPFLRLITSSSRTAHTCSPFPDVLSGWNMKEARGL